MIIRVEIVNGDEVAQRIAEILANKLDKITNVDDVANTDLGSDVYERELKPDHGLPYQRGVRHGGVVDGGGLVDETTAP
jgi:hypothetical protein